MLSFSQRSFGQPPHRAGCTGVAVLRKTRSSGQTVWHCVRGEDAPCWRKSCRGIGTALLHRGSCPEHKSNPSASRDGLMKTCENPWLLAVKACKLLCCLSGHSVCWRERLQDWCASVRLRLQNLQRSLAIFVKTQEEVSLWSVQEHKKGLQLVFMSHVAGRQRWLGAWIPFDLSRS